ncbi:DUF397 domain-containing protein [Streptomyces sp. NPDC087425]|uniref:DUF397 domain-containing protein n=1 Tax=Streptomyces sp. NPDC087425 TaxID=3365787 RepID=UPI0037F91189
MTPNQNTPAPDWMKSSYSTNGGNCVEWAPQHAAATGEFLVRDSKNPHGPQLALTANGFAGLVTFAKRNG